MTSRIDKEKEFYQGKARIMIYIVAISTVISIAFLIAREKAKLKWTHIYKHDKGYIQSLLHYQNI